MRPLAYVVATRALNALADVSVVLSDLQKKYNAFLREFENSFPIIRGRLVQGIAIDQGTGPYTAQVEHRLGRVPTGWFPVGIWTSSFAGTNIPGLGGTPAPTLGTPAVVYDADEHDERFLNLGCASVAVVAVWVF